MYSSGTTGAPKCIVHGHGGTLLNHLKEHRLHSNMKQGDILFYFTGKVSKNSTENRRTSFFILLFSCFMDDVELGKNDFVLSHGEYLNGNFFGKVNFIDCTWNTDCSLWWFTNHSWLLSSLGSRRWDRVNGYSSMILPNPFVLELPFSVVVLDIYPH